MLLTYLITFIIATSTNAHIVRLDCLYFGNFTIKVPQKSTNGIVLNTFIAGDVDCKLNCVATNQCEGINFKTATSECQLMANVTDDNLKSSDGITYHSTNRKDIFNYGPTCESLKPCAFQSVCRDSCVDSEGYKCTSGAFTNPASSDSGGTIAMSSHYGGYASHQPSNCNDNNVETYCATEPFGQDPNPWVELTLPQPSTIFAVVTAIPKDGSQRDFIGYKINIEIDGDYHFFAETNQTRDEQFSIHTNNAQTFHGEKVHISKTNADDVFLLTEVFVLVKKNGFW